MNFNAPWKLCSNELDQEFQIVDSDHIPLVKVLAMSRAIKPWFNKKLSARDLWRQLTNQSERDKINLMLLAPELLEALQQLKEAVEFTPMGVRGIKAVEQANQIINRITGD